MNRWDDQFKAILKDVAENGKLVQAQEGLSVGSQHTTREISNYQFELSNPRDRILFSHARGIKLVSAVARFVWMLSGSDQLEDIAFYEPKVRSFSDDNISVPGSNYGTRLVRSKPGLNQIVSAANRIKSDPATRRAAAVIWIAEDAVRESKDIPCAFGAFYHVRDGLLCTTTVMRSNAANRLLPFNVFEFSLLAELVATLSGFPLGTYTHFAVSMHLYDNEMKLVENVLNEASADIGPPMPSMPQETTWDTVTKLVKFSERLRVATGGLTNTNSREFIAECAGFAPYWRDFARVLLVHSLFSRNLVRLGNNVISDTSEPFRSMLSRHPMAQDAELANLEENETLLESRLNLLRSHRKYSDIPLLDRETTWDKWVQQFFSQRQERGVKLRETGAVMTEQLWDSEFDEQRVKKQPSLFGREAE